MTVKLIIGLGNPGKKYEGTRHNAGFLCVDELARITNVQQFNLKAKFESEVAELRTPDGRILLVKPSTYMNNSGRAVASLKDFYNIEPENITVVHDDLDIRLGEYKIQTGKGPKVHNGIASIEQHLRTESFMRVRIGVDNRTERTMPGKDYVLQKFTEEEMKMLETVLQKITPELLRT